MQIVQPTVMRVPVAGVLRSVGVEEFNPNQITEQHGRDKWSAEFGHGAGITQLTGQTWCWRGPETDWRLTFLRAT